MSKTKSYARDTNTETAILEAAGRIFTRSGYAATRMEAIAAEAGINRALLHYYFRSKERLFKMVFEQNFKQFYANFVPIIQSDEPIEDRIRKLVSAETDMLLEHPDLPLFVLTEVARSREFISETMDVSKLRGIFAELALVLLTEAEKGKIRPVDPRLVIMHLMSLCVFPFAAKPLFSAVTGTSEEEFKSLIISRKELVTESILQLIKP